MNSIRSSLGSLRAALFFSVCLLGSNLSAQTVLSYHGNCGGHFDPVPGAVAQFPGLSLTQTTDLATFQTQFAMGGWDLVIFDEYGSFITPAELDSLSMQLAMGGSVLFYYWGSFADGFTPSHPLFTTDCPATFTGDYTTPASWNAWDPAHPVLNSPNPLTFPLAAPFDNCVADGQFVEPTGGSTAIAGISPTPAANMAGIILNPTNRMIFNTQILGLFSNADAVDLMANEIGFLLGCRGECIVPYSINPTVTGLPPARTSDDTVLLDTSQCGIDQQTPSCQATSGDDGFARFTAPFDGMAVADTCGMGTTFDTILVAYDGTGGCGGLMEIACNDDAMTACGPTMLSSEVTFPITAGTTYYLLVDGFLGATGMAELRLQLTEVPIDYVPCAGISPNSISAAAPRGTAIEQIQLASTTAGGSQVAWIPCYDQYYAFDTGVGGAYEVFDNTGAQVSTSSMVSVTGRSVFIDPATGLLHLISAGAMTGGGMNDGFFEAGLDVNAFFDGTDVQLVASIPGLIGNNTAPAFDYDRSVLYSREGGDTVNVVDMTGTMIGTITLDSAAAGSPMFVANGIAYTGIFGNELLVGSADAVYIFNLMGNFVASVPLGVTVAPGDFSGSFVDDLYWTWDGTTSQWRGFDIFDTNFTIACSTSAPANDLVLAAGAHTIDTDTGDIDGMPSMSWNGTAFEFDNVDIQAGATVAVSGSQGLVILATSDITVDGDIDAAGSDGTMGLGCNDDAGLGGAGGPGGGAGGDGGRTAALITVDGSPGMGPGGGGGGIGDDAGGGGGGFAMMGGNGSADGTGTGGTGGSPYVFILPTIFGGSGGGGGSADDDTPAGVDPTDDGGSGGGGGGGAVVLNAGGILTVGGTIDVSGGDGAPANCSSGSGGGGSGGYIALLDSTGAPVVTGTLDISGGLGNTSGSDSGDGADGRTFIDMTPCGGIGCTITGPAAPPTSSNVTVMVDAMTAAMTYDASFEFSLDGGMTYALCTAALGPMGAPPVVDNPAIGLVPGMPTAFIWNSSADGVPYPAAGVLVRATVDDGMGMTMCQTAPFDIGCECGDCNLAADGVTITDALIAAQIAAGLSPPAPGTAEQMLCCDTNGDMSITVIDALQMAQSSAGLPFFPLCP